MSNERGDVDVRVGESKACDIQDAFPLADICLGIHVLGFYG